MRFKIGRFGGSKPPVAEESCGCSGLSESLLRRMAAKIKLGLTAHESAGTAEDAAPSHFDQIQGVPIWLLEAEGWEPGDNPGDYFDLPEGFAPESDLTPEWYEQLEAEYAVLDAELGGGSAP